MSTYYFFIDWIVVSSEEDVLEKSPSIHNQKSNKYADMLIQILLHDQNLPALLENDVPGIQASLLRTFSFNHYIF